MSGDLMKRLAGVGIIAAMVAVGLGLFFLLGGNWLILGGLAIVFAGIGAWVGGVMLGVYLWDMVHWVLGAVVLVIVMLVAPPILLTLASMPWWLVYGMYGFIVVVFGGAAGIGALGTYAMELIKGEK